MAESATDARADESPGRTFRAVADAETVQQTVALVGAIVDECRVSLGDEGIEILAMDPATVAAVDLELEADAFESYESAGGRIGVDLERLGDIVDMADADQPVRLALDAETRTLRITIDDLDYTLGLIDPETIRSPPDPSDLAFDSDGKVVLPAAELERAIRAADMVSDHVVFGIDGDDEAFYAEAEGDTDDVSLVRSGDDLVSLTPEDAHSLFSVDYLQSIDGELPRDAEVDLQLGTERPLAAQCEFAEGAGSVEYFVSPRVSQR